jgi:hypothetical protein
MVRVLITSVAVASAAPTTAMPSATAYRPGFHREIAPDLANATDSHTAPTKKLAMRGESWRSLRSADGPRQRQMTARSVERP